MFFSYTAPAYLFMECTLYSYLFSTFFSHLFIYLFICHLNSQECSHEPTDVAHDFFPFKCTFFLFTKLFLHINAMGYKFNFV